MDIYLIYTLITLNSMKLSYFSTKIIKHAFQFDNVDIFYSKTVLKFLKRLIVSVFSSNLFLL